jgi:hypothetical protein
MFGPFQNLKGRGGIASLIFFALILAGWAAIHAFGPQINPAQNRAAVTGFFILVGAFLVGVSLALLRLLFRAVTKR